MALARAALRQDHNDRLVRGLLPRLRVDDPGLTIATRYVPGTRGEEEHADAQRPDLVLLDLNLPRVDGREVLADIKASEALRSIPVVVLSTSEAEEDILRSYDLHADAYVSKPVDFDAFVRIVSQIDDFFLTVVRLPRQR